MFRLTCLFSFVKHHGNRGFEVLSNKQHLIKLDLVAPEHEHCLNTQFFFYIAQILSDKKYLKLEKNNYFAFNVI